MDLDLILEKIKSLENNDFIGRKVILNDFTNNIHNNNEKKHTNQIMKDSKIKDYRMQEEYGEKKFIKP